MGFDPKWTTAKASRFCRPLIVYMMDPLITPPPPLSLMTYTSCVFLINVAVCYLYEYYVYSALFFTLFVTSIIYHTNGQLAYSYIADKIAILAVVFYGGYMFYNKHQEWSAYHFISIATFLGAITLYYLGYIQNRFCFDCDKMTADFYHGLIHFISCIGHICIVLM